MAHYHSKKIVGRERREKKNYNLFTKRNFEKGKNYAWIFFLTFFKEAALFKETLVFLKRLKLLKEFFLVSVIFFFFVLLKFMFGDFRLGFMIPSSFCQLRD